MLYGDKENNFKTINMEINYRFMRRRCHFRHIPHVMHVISFWLSVDKVRDKNNLRSFKSSEHINEKMDGPYRGFDFSDPVDLAKWSQREIL